MDPSGRSTGLLVVLYNLAFLPLAFAIPLAGLAGPGFSAGFLILGLGMLMLSDRLRRRLDPQSARRLFLASVIQLPLVLALLLLDPSRPAPDAQLQARRLPAAEIVQAGADPAGAEAAP